MIRIVLEAKHAEGHVLQVTSYGSNTLHALEWQSQTFDSDRTCYMLPCFSPVALRYVKDMTVRAT